MSRHRYSIAWMACLSALVLRAQPSPDHGPFRVQSRLGRCLSTVASSNLPVTPNPPAASRAIFLDDCAHIGIVAQPNPQDIWTHEVNANHDVILRSGNYVLGVGTPIAGVGSPIELQPLNGPPTPNQIFALDGDTIMLAARRELVLVPRGGSGVKSTPIVLTDRRLDDTEFWRFRGTGSYARPTNGFVRVPQEKDLVSAVRFAGWGTVIDIDPYAAIGLNGVPALQIPAGVTIRGDSGLGRDRALLFRTDIPADPLSSILSIQSEFVRVTGLSIKGPTDDSTHDFGRTNGILIENIAGQPLGPHVIVDHNELLWWTRAAVIVIADINGPRTCVPVPDPRPFNTLVTRNFIHHNQDNHEGYGIDSSSGGFVAVVGNTFLSNRHAISSDGTALSAYGAFANLVLSPVPPGYKAQQDFDMHGVGTKPDPGSHGYYGGIAGASVSIQGNTFLGTNRHNFELRGQPCGVDRFQNNIVRQDQESAIQYFDIHGVRGLPWPPYPDWLQVSGSFEAANPTSALAVGDFDGDGADDLFMATGAAWYYSSGGRAQWRYLNTMPDPMSQLRFGDFDGDGRTDVFTQHGRDWLVSFGGSQPWVKINESNAHISDFAVGDFTGDRRADVFYARGDEWFVSDAGTGPFVPYAKSERKVSQLRFGDFDGDGKTDVMCVVDNLWQVVFASDPAHQWRKLRGKLTETTAALVVADFDGNGRADIALATPVMSGNTLLGTQWKFSPDGTGDWKPLRFIPYNTPFAAVGRFDAAKGADILIWNKDALQILSSGIAAAQPFSLFDMR